MSEKANAASLALIRGDEVLLIRRALPPYAKLWTFPGGRMEAGESAEECARREVREELGVTVAGLGHVETQVLAGTRWRLAVYASEEFTGEIEPSAEILEYRWTRLTEVAQVDGTPGLAEVARRALGVVGSVRRARDSQPPTPDLSPRGGGRRL